MGCLAAARVHRKPLAWFRRPVDRIGIFSEQSVEERKNVAAQGIPRGVGIREQEAVVPGDFQLIEAELELALKLRLPFQQIGRASCRERV